MKKLITFILAFVLLAFTTTKSASALTRVRGYYKPSTYKYVAPHYRTSPNRIKIDNYSTKGNYNPFTGKKGYKSWY